MSSDFTGIGNLPAGGAAMTRGQAFARLPTVLGYLGLGIAAILILGVVATVVRDGHN